MLKWITDLAHDMIADCIQQDACYALCSDIFLADGSVYEVSMVGPHALDVSLSNINVIAQWPGLMSVCPC